MYPQVFGKYVLEKELSRGGMARVILATLRGAGGFEKRLVVKQIRDELAFDQQFIRRFVEEAKTTVALSHPNIVPVYELGVEQGTYFLAMELVEGLSVGDLIAQRDVLTPEEGAYVGVEVCRALDYAHRRMKVVHRDITPRNVMIDEEGQIKLIDFGIAAPALVAGHEILGSPGHMAPEQIDGGELGPPTDIFAVAVLLLEAWTGTAPFRRATPEECAAAVREPHPKPSDFDARLAPLDDPIARAMNVDPKQRQQEASELARSLRAFLQGVDVADIARALGNRVHDAREEALSPAPPSRVPARSEQASSPIDLGTRTFAARDEWSAADDVAPPSTRALPDAPKSGGADEVPPPSTRALSDAPAKSVRPRADSAPAPSTRALPDAPRPTSAAVNEHVEAAPYPELPPEPQTAAADPPSASSAAEITVRSAARAADANSAERRIVEESARRSGAAAPERRSGLLVVVVLAAAITGLAVWRGRSEPSVPPPPPPSATATQSVAVAPLVSAPVASESAAPTASVAPSATASVAAVSTSARASVAFVGEPGTRVAVDGAPRGACPVHVALEPGRHDVRFTFDPTSESRGESFTVKSGEHVTVRAEFTGATPTIRVQR